MSKVHVVVVNHLPFKFPFFFKEKKKPIKYHFNVHLLTPCVIVIKCFIVYQSYIGKFCLSKCPFCCIFVLTTEKLESVGLAITKYLFTYKLAMHNYL